MSDTFTDFLSFKHECMNMIKTVLDNQNAIKQELFVLRNLKPEAKPAVTVVDAATEVDLSNHTTDDHHPPSERHSQSNAPDPKTDTSISSKSVSGKESSSTPLTVTPSPLLYMSDFDNLIDASKLKEVTNINNTFKKISVHKEGTLAEFLPKFVDEQVKTINPEYLLLHTGSSNLSRSRKKNSRNIFEHSKQDAVIIASNVFSTAVRALKCNSHLKKVIVFKQPQNKSKSFSRRSKLAQFFNDTIYDLWLRSPLKNSIILGNDSFDKKEATENAIDLASYAMKTRSERKQVQWQTIHTGGPQHTHQNYYNISTFNRFAVLGN